MSSRVSIPPTARLIGSAQPPRPRPLRVDPRGLVSRVMPRFTATPSSHALVVRVRNMSAAILSPASSGLPCGRPRRPTTPERAVDFTRARLAPPLGPCDACQLTLTRPSVPPCGVRRPAGFTSPSSARVANLPALFHAGSSMGTRPSGASPRPTPHAPLGSCRPPCRLPPRGVAAPRISAIVRVRSPRAGVVHAVTGSLPSWLFPPFEDDLPASSHTSAGHPLMGFSHVSEPRFPLRFAFSPLTRALFRVSEIRKMRLVSKPSSVGFVSRLSAL
jgi:hypothetical protein